MAFGGTGKSRAPNHAQRKESHGYDDICQPELGFGGALVSIVTPLFNRAGLIERCLQSVEAQTFRQIEHIIVDDGSEDDPWAVLDGYMNRVDYPVMILHKTNGGVHTARNEGIRRARGTYLQLLDSDDELVPEAIERAMSAWKAIPKNELSRCREVVFRCVDQDGNELGGEFPSNINDLPPKDRMRKCDATGAEHGSLKRLDIMKDNPWPEPEGVTFVTEDILWRKLDREYSSWFINDALRVYHLEGADHLSGGGKASADDAQTARNHVWNTSYMLDHWDTYGTGGFLSRIKLLIRYRVFMEVLNELDPVFARRCILQNKLMRVESMLLTPASILLKGHYLDS